MYVSRHSLRESLLRPGRFIAQKNEKHYAKETSQTFYGCC